MIKDREPCNHPGCLNHTTHPCEGCGRIGGVSIRINPWKPITDDIKDGIQIVDIWINNNRISKCKWNKKTGCWRSYAGRYYMGATHYIPDPPPPPEV
jgi:hypothetical protein